jgi:hypothetical protein
MKAVVIENEYDVDNAVKAFVKDNPELFTEVKEFTFAQHRQEEIVETVLKSDAIIVATTFMYKDQVEDYLDAFLKPEFPLKTIYVHTLLYRLNEWKRGWGEEKALFDKIKQVLKKGFKIYDFREDPDGKQDIMDGLNKLQSLFISEDEQNLHGRAKMIPFELKYSDEHDLFYIENRYYDLKNQIEDEQEELDRKAKRGY